MRFQFDDGGRSEAGREGRTGDCVARAIAIAAQLPYENVYEALAAGNANQRRGKYKSSKDGKRTASHGISTKRKWFDEYMQSLGFKWTPTMFVGQGCKVHLKSDELPNGRIIVSLSRHMAAVIDGVLHDTYDCSRDEKRCVYGYYSIA